MPKFKNKTIIVDAVQWFKNGDHPLDDCGTFIDECGQEFRGEGHVVRYFRRPDISDDAVCPDCGKIMHVHGWIDKLGPTLDCTVCPGDWVITQPNGNVVVCKCGISRLILWTNLLMCRNEWL